MIARFAAAIALLRSETHSPDYGLSEKHASASENPRGP